MSETIAVIGAGAWGTALAANAAGAGHTVRLWTRDGAIVEEINTHQSNQHYLPDIALPDTIFATGDLAEACDHSNIILLCTPAQTLSDMVRQVKASAQAGATLISCAKGIDRASGNTMTAIMAEIASDHPVAVLSGPSFAVDVAQFLPTAVTVAAPDIEAALNLCRTLSNTTLRCYASDDMAGVEIGGALKNVLAIGVGITRGRGLGASAEAALIARGFAEMTRVGAQLGARADTIAGLSGLGDLVLTCSSPKSRNFAYGMAIGENQSLDDMKLAEGAHTASIASDIAKREQIDAPIIDAVTQILENRTGVDDAIASLLARPIKGE